MDKENMKNEKKASTESSDRKWRTRELNSRQSLTRVATSFDSDWFHRDSAEQTALGGIIIILRKDSKKKRDEMRAQLTQNIKTVVQLMLRLRK